LRIETKESSGTPPPAVSNPSRLSHYLLVLSAAWMIAMTWRVYPQFRDMLKVEDRLVTLDDYVEESCGQRVGPGAASCVEEARLTGRRLVAQQQGRSLLFVAAPLLAYLAIYLPWRRLSARAAPSASLDA
jgi:hypothetical protein